MQLTPLCTPDVSVKTRSTSGEAVPVRCKRWSCEECAKANKRQVIRAGIAGNPRALLTLTVSSKHYETPELAALALKRGLRNLRLDLKRHPKLKNFEYLAVFEEHQSGYPHMHLLITGKYIPWQYLRQVWERITGSIHIHIKKIPNARQAAAYCAKYISKSLKAYEGCKRWWRSHGYPRPEDRPDDDPEARRGWGRWEINANEMAFNLKMAGYTVTQEPNGKIRWLWAKTNEEPPGWQWAASGGYNHLRSKGFRR